MESPPFGAYFLADDGAYEWAAAMLNSLRAVDSDVRLVCVPFSDRSGRINTLRAKYRFEVLEDQMLPRLDEIGLSLRMGKWRPQLAGAFRKLAMFWGPLDRFIYLDADIVISEGWNDLIRQAARPDFDLLYAHSDIDQVYLPGPLRQRMTKEYATSAINTGLWSSRKGLFSLHDVERYARHAERDAADFCATLEQPFLNYCLDIRRCYIESYEVASDHIVSCHWAGGNSLVVDRPSGSKPIRVRGRDGRLVAAVHWAGFHLGAEMPYYDLYEHHRLASMSAVERIVTFARKFKALALWCAGRLAKWVRQRRRINCCH